MLLSYEELIKLIELGVIDADPENVNSSSIDITLDKFIMVEQQSLHSVDLIEKESIQLNQLNIQETGKLLFPGEFILASSRETFNLPNNISAEYKLKSTMARNGLEHLNAGWCDAGWHSSKLTLELKNMTLSHVLKLSYGMKIGQVVFFKHNSVPEEKSYTRRGQYNHQGKVQQAKELK